MLNIFLNLKLHAVSKASTFLKGNICRPALTLLPLGVQLFGELGDPLGDPKSYRRLIAHLLYLNFTMPDITFAV